MEYSFLQSVSDLRDILSKIIGQNAKNKLEQVELGRNDPTIAVSLAGRSTHPRIDVSACVELSRNLRECTVRRKIVIVFVFWCYLYYRKIFL